MIRSILRFLTALFFLLILIRCANPVAPEGGRKDIEPPVVTGCDPPDLTLNFHEKNIRITFDEFLQLKDPATQITFSPPRLPHTDIRLRGKSVLITLKDSLVPNTTYSINFGNAITDLTEGNILRDYSYTFSTGSYIDSMSISGKVLDAFDLTPRKEVYVMLFINENDSLPLDSLPLHVPPYYMTKTRENGEFSFRNLRNVPYLLFALEDLNGDFIADPKGEPIAFCDSLISGTYLRPGMPDTLKADSLQERKSVEADTTTRQDTGLHSRFSGPSYTLNLFREVDSVQKILKADLVSEDQVAIYFRVPAVNPRFIPLNLEPASDWMVPEINTASDTVFLWLKNPGRDSLYLRIVDRDQTLDTARINLTKKTAKKKKSEKSGPADKMLELTTNMPDGKLNQFVKNPLIYFSYPVSSYDLSRILLVDGKDTVKPRTAFTDKVNRTLRIQYNWAEGLFYRVIFPDSTFLSINGRSNDTVIYTFKTYSLRDLGSLQMNVSFRNPAGNYIFQLLNDNETVMDQRTVTADTKIRFEYLFPGKYRIKVILDKNHNGRWDPGKYSTRIQPETVKYFPKTIEVRANWDVEEEWEL